MRFGQKFGLRLAKAHRAARATLHLAHEENPHTQNKDHWKPGKENTQKRAGTVAFRTGCDSHTLFFKTGNQSGITRRIGLEGRAVIGKRTANPLTSDRYRLHAPVGNVVDKLGIGNFTGIGALARTLEQVEQRDQEQSNDRPKGEVAIVRIHNGSNRYHGHPARTGRCFDLT